MVRSAINNTHTHTHTQCAIQIPTTLLAWKKKSAGNNFYILRFRFSFFPRLCFLQMNQWNCFPNLYILYISINTVMRYHLLLLQNFWPALVRKKIINTHFGCHLPCHAVGIFVKTALKIIWYTRMFIIYTHNNNTYTYHRGRLWMRMRIHTRRYYSAWTS